MTSSFEAGFERFARMLADRTRRSYASLHIDAAGLIRIGETNDERLRNFERILVRTEELGGRLMVPAFSYTFPKRQPYDIRETPSDVGAVTDFLRRRHTHRRTVDSMFSYLLFDGGHGDRHLRDGDYESFGDESLIADLYKTHGFICCVGGVFHNTPTEAHFLERKIGVSYRFDKRFTGTVINARGETYTQNLVFYCRKLELGLIADMTRLESEAREEGLIATWSVPDLEFEIEALNVADLEPFLRRRLELDPYFLCTTEEDFKENWRARNSAAETRKRVSPKPQR